MKLQRQAYIVFCCVLSTFVSQELNAQSTLGNTPFSRQSLGESLEQGMSRNQAMGGVIVGNPQSDFLNLGNPAELVYNRVTNFETTLRLTQRDILSPKGAFKSAALSLSHVAFGFPIGKKANLAIGIRPDRALDYDVSYTSAVSGSNTDTASYKIRGTGGVTKVFLATGFKANKQLAFGIEGGLHLGTFSQYKQFLVLGRADEPISQINNEKQTRWFSIKPGFVYRLKLDSLAKEYLTFGATYELSGLTLSNNKVLSQQLTTFYNDPFFGDTLL
jgi:hypothetical protein